MKYLLLFLVLSTVAHAECRNVSRCDYNGYNCQIVQLCDNTYDAPAINYVAPQYQYPGFKPIDTVAPIGVQDCSMENINGHWRRVCR